MKKINQTNKKKYLKGIILTTFLGLCFSGMMGQTRGASTNPIQDVTFRCAIQNDVTTLDPNRAGRGATAFILFYVNQGLVHPSGLDWRPLPCVADSWQMLSPTSWQFNLRKGITFHNGDLLTSADVQFSYYRQMGKIDRRYPGAAKAEFRRMIEKIDTPDDHTVIIHTKEPEVSMLSYVISGSVYIVPQKHVEKMGDREFGKHPVGSGPFIFKERRPSEYVAFEANEKYWNVDPLPGTMKTPEIKNVQYRVIPKFQTALAALLSGEIDGIQNLPTDMIRDLEKKQDIRIIYTQQNTPVFVMMNWLNSKDEKTGQPNPFFDVRVRRALNHALDLDTLIKNYGTGHEKRTTLVGQGSIGYNPDVQFYSFDPSKAKRLLEEAGFPDGFKTKMAVLADRAPFQDAMAQYWRDIRVEVEYDITTLPVVMTKMMKKDLEGLVVWTGGRGYDTTSGFYEVYVRGKGTYSLHPTDEKVEALLDRQGVEFDEGKRAELIHQITRILWEDAWFIPLFEGVVIKVLRNEWEYDHLPSVNSFYLTNLRKK